MPTPSWRTAAVPLAELQRRFVDAVLAGTGDLPEAILPAGLASATRLDVYRNNTFGNLGDRLAAVYPVTQRLVGADFFRYAGRAYIREQPSHSGDLSDYGASFADFLTAFEPAYGLPYLADVARLEWARHEAERAADHPPLEISSLAGIDPDDYERLKFVLHSTVRLVVSPYPIERIWQVNQPDYRGEPWVDLDAGGCRLLIWRHDFDIRQRSIGDGSARLLAALDCGQNLAAACEQGLAAEPDCDISAELQQLVASQVIVDFVL